MRRVVVGLVVVGASSAIIGFRVGKITFIARLLAQLVDFGGVRRLVLLVLLEIRLLAFVLEVAPGLRECLVHVEVVLGGFALADGVTFAFAEAGDRLVNARFI